MGRHDEKFSDEQRAAIAYAVAERGYSAAEVVELARDGQLEGVPAFDVSPSTVQPLASQARERVPAEQPGPAIDPATEQVRRVAQATIKRVEELDSPTAKDLSALREAHRVLEQLDRAERRARPRQASQNEEMSEEGKLLLAQMVSDLEAIQSFEAGGPCEPHDPSPHGPYCQRCREPLDEPAAKRAQAEQDRAVAATLERLKREEPAENPPAA